MVDELLDEWFDFLYVDEPHAKIGNFLVPGPVWRRLYEYQQTSVKWLAGLHDEQ